MAAPPKESPKDLWHRTLGGKPVAIIHDAAKGVKEGLSGFGQLEAGYKFPYKFRNELFAIMQRPT